MLKARKLSALILVVISSILIFESGCQEPQKGSQRVKTDKMERWIPPTDDNKGKWVEYDQKESLKGKFCNTLKFKITFDVNLPKDEQTLFSTEPPGWIMHVRAEVSPPIQCRFRVC